MRYILGVLATIFILIAVIFWALSGGPSEVVEEDDAAKLSTYADSSAKVSYEVRGEIVANEEHQSIRFTIDRNQRVFEVFDGYQKKVIKKKTFSNNSKAYEEFIYALDRAGFINQQEADFDTEKGVCPEGNVMVYKLADQGEDISRLWSGSCDDEAGTFGGDDDDVEDLFEAQIPDYRDIARDVNL
ncbi:MAG: hypothetical protein U5L95_02390 [Candidatus Saccharibacteria bacterium]|nr:hypothetical protein [Candidatus Saccharibacteria bacterium]